jgi:predicted amidohydrolase
MRRVQKEDGREAQLRLAVAQPSVAPGGVAANAALAAELIDRAAGAGADAVLFPELFLCGYELGLLDQPAAVDVRVDDPRLDPVAHACRAGSVAAVVGASLADAGRRTISSIVFGGGGDVIAVYDKMHLDSTERLLYSPGERPCTVTVRGWRLGLAICYDVSFPEHARAYALAGADAYLCSGAFFVGHSSLRRDIYFPARALENTMYVAFSNFPAASSGPGYCGRSAVYGPDGAAVAEAGADESGLVIAELDRSVLVATRETLTMLGEATPATEAVAVIGAP